MTPGYRFLRVQRMSSGNVQPYNKRTIMCVSIKNILKSSSLNCLLNIFSCPVLFGCCPLTFHHALKICLSNNMGWTRILNHVDMVFKNKM